MVISHNMASFNANRQYGIVNIRKAKSTEKLASGYKINRAADDAAGLTISTKMRAQIRGLNQGTDNIQDGISVCQIMDGALTETQDIMHRMTELTVKAANATLDDQERRAIQAEINDLLQELDRITQSTNFNDKQLLACINNESHPVNIDGGRADIVFAIDNTGSMGSHVNNVMNNLNSFAGGLSNCNVQYGVVEFGDRTSTSTPFMTNSSDVVNRLAQIRCSGGGDYNEAALEGVMDAINFPFRSDASAKEVILITDAPYHDANGDGLSRFTDTEVAQALNDAGIRLSVVTSPSCMSRYSSTLANGSVLSIEGSFYDSLMSLAEDISETAGESFHKDPLDIDIQMSGKVDDIFTIHTYDIRTSTLGLSDLSCLTEEDARSGIDKVKKASAKISEIRSNIGAEQNALEHNYRINQNTSENTQTAESSIRDTDMASEMVKFARENILARVGESMLAQANQSKQGVMALLT